MQNTERLGEDQLMIRLAEGDLSSLGELYARHHQGLRMTLLKWAPEMSEADREDVVQEVFIALNQSASKYVEQSRFISWFYKIAFHTATHWWRRQRVRSLFLKRQQHPVAIARPHEKSSPESKTSLRKMASQILDQLPKELRVTVWLHFAEGLDGKEIAEAMGVRRTTVYTRLHRARQILLTDANYHSWMEALVGEKSP